MEDEKNIIIAITSREGDEIYDVLRGVCKHHCTNDVFVDKLHKSWSYHEDKMIKTPHLYVSTIK